MRVICSGCDHRAVYWPPIADSLFRQGAVKFGPLLSHNLVAERKASEIFSTLLKHIKAHPTGLFLPQPGAAKYA